MFLDVIGEVVQRQVVGIIILKKSVLLIMVQEGEVVCGILVLGN
jgi:hypothetical protein